MKKIIAMLLAASVMIPIVLFAQPNEAASFPVVNWISKNSNDPISIQNGAGTTILIQINVSGGGASAPGVTVKNCGTTTSISAGSSTICETSNNKSPVTITSDNPGTPATGTYQIKTKQ